MHVITDTCTDTSSTRPRNRPLQTRPCGGGSDCKSVIPGSSPGAASILPSSHIPPKPQRWAGGGGFLGALLECDEKAIGEVARGAEGAVNVPEPELEVPGFTRLDGNTSFGGGRVVQVEL